MSSWSNDYNLGTKLQDGEYYSAGLAYIVIPSDVDREKFITECYKTSTVSIFSEHNGFCNRVPIDTFSLNFINFPDKVDEMGSAVSYLLDPVHSRPIIVGIYNTKDEISGLKENKFS